MTSTTTRTTSPATTPHTPHLTLHNKSKGAGNERRGGYTSLRKHPQHFLAYSIISILVFLCWLPDFIVALKDVSVTIPQAVKRGSNAMLTCNYDMENDTLYSVKWYKGRREFYRYTPKENPAMKVFLSQNGLNVERNLSNQSHVVLLAVPLNISGKFTCEISVEAPSFQTAMVSGEMEVVELPEEQASVTGIQPRYRIGDLVDGNCSIKYSKPAANLTWTINGIVVPPHHIKTYQIEKFEENNLESVMSAIHFMVTTQHFIKGQMRLKCTASIFDIFKEEIESIIEEDRPRIMASGQSYPPDHGYGTNGESDGYEHNESYLTYFSAPKSSASPTAEFFITKIFKYLQREVVQKLQLSLDGTKTQHIENTLTMTFINDMKRNLKKITQIKMATLATYCTKLLQLMLIKFIITVMVVLLAMMVIQWQKLQRKNPKISTMTTRKESKCNCNEKKRNMKLRKQSLRKNLWYEKLFNTKRRQQDLEEQQEEEEIGNCYHDANNDDDDCQDKCEQQQQQQQEQQHHEQCLVANQNVINEKVFLKDTILTRNTNESFSTTTSSSCDIIDCQQHMSQTLAFTTSTRAIITSATPSLPLLSSLEITAATTSVATTTTAATTLGYRKTYVQDSFPLYALDASKSNNAKYMSKDQTLLMTFTTTTSTTDVAGIAVAAATSYLTSSTGSVIAPFTLMSPLSSPSSPATSSSPLLSSSAIALAATAKFKLLQPTSVAKSSSVEAIASPASPSVPYFCRHNYLMAFIGKLLLHQC